MEKFAQNFHSGKDFVKKNLEQFFRSQGFCIEKVFEGFSCLSGFLFDRFTAKDDRKELGRVERDRLITSLVAINLTIRNSEGEKRLILKMRNYFCLLIFCK